MVLPFRFSSCRVRDVSTASNGYLNMTFARQVRLSNNV
jgi:hypothetical protein